MENMPVVLDSDLWYMFLPAFAAIWYFLHKYHKQGEQIEYWKLRVLIWIPWVIMLFLHYIRRWRFG